ncbi:hypothetical protein U0070_000672 [Myodes glareolus]|uniref:Uncharacterized protein n=1 Tax=Myodes glareolus TaxID=447135 RepID=A0AAW0IH53_MYOGA
MPTCLHSPTSACSASQGRTVPEVLVDFLLFLTLQSSFPSSSLPSFSFPLPLAPLPHPSDLAFPLTSLALPGILTAGLVHCSIVCWQPAAGHAF